MKKQHKLKIMKDTLRDLTARQLDGIQGGGATATLIQAGAPHPATQNLTSGRASGGGSCGNTQP